MARLKRLLMSFYFGLLSPVVASPPLFRILVYFSGAASLRPSQPSGGLLRMACSNNSLLLGLYVQGMGKWWFKVAVSYVASILEKNEIVFRH